MDKIHLETADHVAIEADEYPAFQPCCILAHGKAYEKGPESVSLLPGSGSNAMFSMV